MSQIWHFPGAHRLELHRNASADDVFHTISEWENNDGLQAYWHSELFKMVWAQTKIRFAGKPQAWSLLKEIVVEWFTVQGLWKTDNQKL